MADGADRDGFAMHFEQFRLRLRPDPLARDADRLALGLEQLVARAEQPLLLAHRFAVDAARHVVARRAPVLRVLAPHVLEGADAEARLDDRADGMPARLERELRAHAAGCAPARGGSVR